MSETLEPTEATTPDVVTPPTDAATIEPRFTQADLDRIVKERLERAKKQSDTERTKAAEAAREKALAEQGEYKAIAESQAARLAELESKAALIDEYEIALTAQIANAKKGVPSHILELLEAMPPLKQLEYLAKNADKLKPQSVSTNGATARTAQPTEAEQKAREMELRRRFPALNKG
jgi:hypothetical protein